MAVAERTLRRQLAAEGTSYQRLLDEVRVSLADRLLGTGTLTVTQVAQRLGYAEAASFIHAHRRWHGVTPTGRRRSVHSD
jgi:AraC-like DNA-binding protein